MVGLRRVSFSLHLFTIFNQINFATPKTKAALFSATQVNSGGVKNKGHDINHEMIQESNVNPCCTKDYTRKLLENIEENHSSKTIDKPAKISNGLKHLKVHLLSKFDRNLHPIEPGTGNLLVKIGFTFRQILDLDEKNQILKSLIWYHITWKDPQLSWKPENFGGIKNIDLPNNLLWRPDIVVYEEIGVRDYSPRLQNFEIYSTGDVQFREPTVFETTCSINTAFFPFDIQICDLTFVSWTDPVTKTDLVSAIDTKELQHTAKNYFVGTGEWRLIGIAVNKVVRDYAELLKPHPINHSQAFETYLKTEINRSKSNLSSNTESQILSHSTSFSFRKAEFQMPPKSRTTYSSLGNTSLKDTMFAEIKFTVVIRRNSSLYMQSMLFPSILLTAVAVLGFYLPPESGERIGLQITILLTFMVFLLAVGEMFPASTGPYLGIYFVLCMGLLGINLAMTVLVLNLHFKPVIVPDPDLHGVIRDDLNRNRKYKPCCSCNHSTQNKKIALRLKACKCDGSAIPKFLRQFLRFCDRYWSLNEYNAKWLHDYCVSKDEENLDICESSANDELNVDSDDELTSYSNSELLASNKPEKERRRSSNDQHQLTVPICKSQSSKSVYKSTSAIPTLKIEDKNHSEFFSSEEQKQKFSSAPTVESEHAAVCKDQNPSALFWKKTRENSSYSEKQHRSLASDQQQNILLNNSRKEAHFLRNRLINALQDVKSQAKKKKKMQNDLKAIKQKREDRKKHKKQKAQERQEMEQQEWKSVARAIDTLCFRLYVIFIIVSHLGLFVIAIENWYTDYNFNVTAIN